MVVVAAGDDRCDERSGSTAPLTLSSSEEWEQSISSLWNIKAGVSGSTTLLAQLSGPALVIANEHFDVTQRFSVSDSWEF